MWSLTMQDMAFYLVLEEIGFACAAMPRADARGEARAGAGMFNLLCQKLMRRRLS